MIIYVHNVPKVCICIVTFVSMIYLIAYHIKMGLIAQNAKQGTILIIRLGLIENALIILVNRLFF